jgi:LAGLIDADG endonuclease
MTEEEFNQWFSGFTDGEGSFLIGKVKDTDNFYFRFYIKLHVDDLKALEYIKSKLNCGISFIFGNSANFNVTKISDISGIIIPILLRFPLNGVKHLDLLAFNKAITIYLDGSLSKVKKSELILQLKNSMNKSRVKINMPSNHTIRITPY